MNKLTILTACIGLLLITGCNTYKKQLSKATAFFTANSNELAKICADKFPVQEKKGELIIDSTKKADNKNYQPTIDSLKAKADQLTDSINKVASDKSNPCAELATSYLAKINELKAQVSWLQSNYQKCKPDTLFKTQTIYITDKAAQTVAENNYAVAKDSLNIYKTKLTASEEQSSSRGKWLLKLSIALAIVAFVAVLKFIGKI